MTRSRGTPPPRAGDPPLAITRTRAALLADIDAGYVTRHISTWSTGRAIVTARMGELIHAGLASVQHRPLRDAAVLTDAGRTALAATRQAQP